MATSTSNPPRWLDAREQAAWRGLLDMHAQLTARLNREMQEHSGISITDFAVLVRLSEHEAGRMRVLELARALGWEKSRLSHQLSRMQQRGLVERSNCSEDRRGAFIVLTAHGRDTVGAAAPEHVNAVRRYLFDELSSDQVDALAAISYRVRERLTADGPGADQPCGDAGSVES